VKYQLFALRFDQFWKEHPALLAAIFALIFTSFALAPHAIYLYPLLLLFLFALYPPLFAKLRTALIIGLLFYPYALAMQHSSLEEESGRAYFHIESLKTIKSPFHQKLLYSGTVRRFVSDQGDHYRRLPCIISLTQKDHPQADCDYLICGTLAKQRSGTYFLKPDKTPWEKVPNTFSLAEWRHKTKQKFHRFFEKKLQSPLAASFISALITGQLDDYSLPLAFQKCGLQHILALSGFHFGLLIFFAAFFLRLIFPPRFVLAALLLIITLYAFFIGSSPSIQRSYIAIFLFLIAKLFQLNTSGLNVLGAGLIAELIIDPYAIFDIGFQLTFLCTLAILLFFTPCERLFALYFPKRKFSTLTSMSLLDKHGYLLSSLLRKTLALNSAVHILSLPTLLYLFHQFPLMSLLYNLFFPFCVTLTLFFLTLSLLFGLILPPLGNLLHTFNSAFTDLCLATIMTPPSLIDFKLQTPSFPFSLLIIFLTSTLFLGISLRPLPERLVIS
jgi:competence protein ComEC